MVAWDDAYREAWRLRRDMMLADPLLDFERLVLVKRHNFGGWDGFFGYTSYLKPPPAELCVPESVRKGAAVRTLLRTDAGCIRDPDVSFDGRRILFAYARDQQDTYHLYEINADGSGLRQLTASPPYSGPEPAPRGAGRASTSPTRTKAAFSRPRWPAPPGDWDCAAKRFSPRATIPATRPPCG